MFFITGSDGKFAEVQALLPTIQRLSLDLPEIQSTDAQEIIAAKLQAAHLQYTGEFIVEDTGLYFDCLNGLPGPLIKWFSQKLGEEGLASLASTLGNTRAQAITWIGYSPSPNQHYFFSGILTGTIVAPRGQNGFGWDAIFQPDGQSRTMGEMSREEKNTLSMRAQAVKKLAQFLQTELVGA